MDASLVFHCGEYSCRCCLDVPIAPPCPAWCSPPGPFPQCRWRCCPVPDGGGGGGDTCRDIRAVPAILAVGPEGVYTNANNVRCNSMFTFDVLNDGPEPIYAVIEDSPDNSTWISEAKETEILPGIADYLVPMAFHYFARIRLRTESGTSTAKVWYNHQMAPTSPRR